MRTAAQQTADRHLKGPVEDWIAMHRRAGKSWRRIALLLYDDTRQEVDISGQAIQNWMTARGASHETEEQSP